MAITRRQFFSRLAIGSTVVIPAIVPARVVLTEYVAHGTLVNQTIHATRVVVHSLVSMRNCIVRVPWTSKVAVYISSAMPHSEFRNNIVTVDPTPIWARILGWGRDTTGFHFK